MNEAVATGQISTILSKGGLDLHQLCSSKNSIEFKNFDGQTLRFTPDTTLGYFQFEFSFGFPVANIYQTAIHPNVIEKSYRSLLNQYLNYEHKMKAYDPEIEDRIIGHIVAVNFPQPPLREGWKVTKASESPNVSGVAAFYKRGQGLKRILGQHMTGSHKWAVSMEIDWPLSECGFAIELNGGKPVLEFTPEDMLKAGYEYIPYDEAPDELTSTFSVKKNRVVAQWKGRRVFVLMGGTDNPVHYAGLALVHDPAERPAKINHMAASAGPSLPQALENLNQVIAETMIGKIIKKGVDSV